MPELPEVETTVRYLKEHIVGRQIQGIKIFSKKQFLDNPNLIVGAKIVGVNRQGKMLLFSLGNDKKILIHLKLTGQLVFAPHLENNQANYPRPIPFSGGNTLPGRATRVVIYFSDNSALFFNDLRKFGWMKIVEGKRIKELENLGIEPLSSRFTIKTLTSLLTGTKRAIKTVLLDQTKIAGIGNIYANEALFLAGVLPQRPANSLTEKEIKKLHQAIISVLKGAIRHQGTSAADDAYVQPDGRSGRFQSRLKVYQRDGEKCFSCKKIIKRIKLGGRGTFFCPHCQK